MVEFIVRPATREDARAIRSLILKVKINPTGLSWRRFLVAVTPQGDLLGCGQVKQHSDGSQELASIAVSVQVRGQGVARAVIEKLLVYEPIRPLYLMCRARLRILYEKFGFHIIGLEEMPPYFLRISRLESIFNSKAQSDSRLLVMRKD